MQLTKGTEGYILHIGVDNKLHIDKCTIIGGDDNQKYRANVNGVEYISIPRENIYLTYKDAVNKAFNGVIEYVKDVISMVTDNSNLGDLEKIIKERYNKMIGKLARDVNMKINDMKI